MRWSLPLLVATLAAFPSAAQETRPGGSNPYVAINVGVDLRGLEASARDAVRAVESLAEAMRQLAIAPSLGPEHKRLILDVVERVDRIAAVVTQTVQGTPSTIREAREAVVGIATDVAAEARRALWLIAGLLVLIVLAVLAGLFFLLLRPSSKLVAEAAGRFSTLADSAERTVALLAEANRAQIELAQALERLHATLSAGRAVQEAPAPAPAAEAPG